MLCYQIEISGPNLAINYVISKLADGLLQCLHQGGHCRADDILPTGARPGMAGNCNVIICDYDIDYGVPPLKKNT